MMFDNTRLLVFGIAMLGADINNVKADEASESDFLSNTRQIIFEGIRSGEGYYNSDGTKLVFQSEREKGNPFYQIYMQDLETGDIDRVSPGYGKTTCAWIAPDNQSVMYASTQFDPEIKAKQEAELEFRASGQTRRYSWDYDPLFDLVQWNQTDGSYKKLTDVEGYDAEGSISPDGNKVAFASNRRAYSGELTPHEIELFKLDPASAMDIYIMNIDGSDVTRLTDIPGYDGGPFFSPDGKRICWRRFSEDGASAEIYTMAIDGSDVKRLTNLTAMSWAPFYHPSGDYLIFTTNLNGFANFELYIVDAAGSQTPIRVTTTDGFDGLPVFTPDGESLTWSSTRTTSKKSQLFTATWNDLAARKALSLDVTPQQTPIEQTPIAQTDDSSLLDQEAMSRAKQAAIAATASFTAADVGRHIDYLCRPELGGRLTGTAGERAASAYVAAYMEQLGLEPVFSSDDGLQTYSQIFPFTSSIRLGEANSLKFNDTQYTVDQQWRPLALSSNSELDATAVVFAGYGIVAPESVDAVDQSDENKINTAEYDSYVHLDVTNKWVLVFRQMPMDITSERRSYLARFSSLRYKALMARERGAAGLIVVSGPTSQAREQLVSLSTDGSLAGSKIAAITVTDELAKQWFAADDKDLVAVQKELDGGDVQMGYELKNVTLSCKIDVEPVKSFGQNTVGLLRCENQDAETILVGAHIDHLGQQAGTNSLAREDERNGIHRGADDNASGVAGILEIAEYLSNEVKNKRLKLKKNVMFGAWSGEELGLLGSAYFEEHLPPMLADEAEPLAHSVNKRQLSAYINLDMVGRLRDALVLQGIGSSPIWRLEIEQRNSLVGLPLVLQEDSYLPTDASTFYIAGVPVLSAFTGQHSEYHTPRDVPELINFEGAAKTARLLGLITRSLAQNEEQVEYTAQKAPENNQMRANLTAYLGTIPDYVAGDIEGVKLSGVSQGGPAEKAGLKGGDVIVELAGRQITNIYDYTYAIEALRVGQPTKIIVLRENEKVLLDVTPASRQ